MSSSSLENDQKPLFILKIPQLIQTIKHSFREHDFNEAKTLLMDRENIMRTEMKNLELKNTKLGDMLQESQRKCVELEERNSELKFKNLENERMMVGVYQEKFLCLDENQKLKSELTNLTKQNEELINRYDALAQDHEKLEGPLIKALVQAIDRARMEGFTEAQQQVVSGTAAFPKTEKKGCDKNVVDELEGEKRPEKIMTQSGNKGLKGSGPNYATEMHMRPDDGATVKQSGETGYYSKIAVPSVPTPATRDTLTATKICGDSHGDGTTTPDGGAHYTSSKTRPNADANNPKRRENSSGRSTLKKRKRTVCESTTDYNDSLPVDDETENEEVFESDSEDKTWSVYRDSFKQGGSKSPSNRIHQSKVTSDNVQQLRMSMGIPLEYKIIIPTPKDRPNNPPPGNFLCFFTNQLHGGLRFPVPTLYSDVARLFNIPLSRLTPNSFCLMAGFAMVVSHLGGEVEPTARLFGSYFYPKVRDGYFFFSPKRDARFLKAYPLSHPDWKKYYFFISSPQPWNFPTSWSDSLVPETTEGATNGRDDDSKSILDRLNQNPYNLSLLVEPSLLYHFGLSPLRQTLLKPLEEIMVECLMKEEVVFDPARRQENNNSDIYSDQEELEVNGSGKHATTDMGEFDGGALVKQQVLLCGGAGYSRKNASPSVPTPARDIVTIEICDSDDETRYASSNSRLNVGEKETKMIFGKISSAPSDRRRDGREKNCPVIIKSTLKKRKRTTVRESDDDDSDSVDETWSLPRHSNLSPPEHGQQPKLPYYCLLGQSKVTPQHVQILRKLAGIPPEYKIVIPSPQDRPNTPPAGNFLCFFIDQLNGGLRFPIPPLYSDIARLFNISLSQLTPNSFRLMAGFSMAVRYLGAEEPTARLFDSYFYPKLRDGFFYFASRRETKFLKGSPLSHPEWKKHYFFISSPPDDQPSCWNFPTHWRESLPEATEGGEITTQGRDHASKSLLDRLNQNPYNLSLLVEPSLLYHFGLSPLCKTLLKPLKEIMVECLMKEEVIFDPTRRHENNSDDTSSDKEELG